jgi:hypothetical protein
MIERDPYRPVTYLSMNRHTDGILADINTDDTDGSASCSSRLYASGLVLSLSADRQVNGVSVSP